MNTQIFKFNEYEICFEFENSNIMVNATQMAKVFGKQVEAFVRNDSTKNFIDEAIKNENSRFLSIQKESDLYVSRQKSGTWMHRILALKFAAWLDPKFDLWVWATVEHLLFGHYEGVDNSLRESAKRKREIEALRKKLYDSDTYKNLEKLEGEEKKAARWRSSQNTKQLRLFMSNN